MTLELLEYSWMYFDEYWCIGQSGHFYSGMGLIYIWLRYLFCEY